MVPNKELGARDYSWCGREEEVCSAYEDCEGDLGRYINDGWLLVEGQKAAERNRLCSARTKRLPLVSFICLHLFVWDTKRVHRPCIMQKRKRALI